MPQLKLSLEAARVNKKLTQPEAIELLQKDGYTLTRQRLGYYEQHPEQTPISLAKALSKIYQVPFNVLFFEP